MNVVAITGRITKDPEVKATEKSTIANFDVAVRRKFKREGDPDADFFSCTAFGKTAEFLEKYGNKGVKLEIHGRLQQQTWKNQEGQNRSKIVIIADDVEFAESKGTSQPSASQQATSTKAQESSRPSADSFMPMSDDLETELPFS